MSTHPHSKASRPLLRLLRVRCKDCSKEIRDGSLGCGPASWENTSALQKHAEVSLKNCIYFIAIHGREHRGREGWQ